MEKYSHCKDSEIEWIGEIPEHWEVTKVKYCLLPGNEGIKIGPFGSALKSEFIKESGFKIYGQENVIRDNFLNGYKYVDEQKYSELINYKIEPGDIVITMMGTTGKAKVVPNEIQVGIMDSHLTRVRVDTTRILPRLLELLINDSFLIAAQIKFHSKGAIMDGLNSTIIKSLILPLPTIKEQFQIVKYLDFKIQRIDKLISDKEKLIEILNEERTAMINQAVTKGLDLSVPMKESGIQWLGGIPHGWKVVKLRHLSISVKTGNTPPSDVLEYYAPAEINWFTPGDFKQLMLNNSKRKVSRKAIEDGKCKLFPKHSVLMIGIGATLGKIGIVLNTSSSNQQINAIVFDESKILPEFGAHFLDSYSSITISMASASTLAILNQNQTKDLYLTVPPISEQHSILKFINEETQRTNILTSKIIEEIELLKEYKTALISEVVTGKVDVRNEIISESLAMV